MSPNKFLFVFSLFHFLSSCWLFSSEEGEIRGKKGGKVLFKKRDQPSQPIVISASFTLLGEKQREKVPVLIEGEHFSVERAFLLEYLEEIVKEEQLKHLQAEFGQSQWLSSSLLTESGILTSFHSGTFHLSVELPVEWKKLQIVSLSRGKKRKREFQGKIIPLSPFSGYVNISMREDYQHKPLAKRLPFSSSFEGALFYRGLVLEGGGEYREKDAHPWKRRAFRFVYDQQGKMIRHTWGEQTHSGEYGQSSLPFLGINMEKNFSLQPQHNYRVEPNYRLFLEHPTTLTIQVNGSQEKKLELQAGEHDLRDFFLSEGLNEIRIHMVDIYGKEETLDFPFITHYELLSPKESTFSCSAGCLTTANATGLSLLRREPLSSISYKQGITDTWTAGGFIQSTRRNFLFGTELLWGTQWGKFRLNNNWGGRYKRGKGFNIRLDYQNFVSQKGAAEASKAPPPLHWGGGIQYTSPFFSSPSASLQEGGGEVANRKNAQIWQFSLRCSRKLFYDIHGSWSGYFQTERLPAEQEKKKIWGMGLSLSKSLDAGLNSSISTQVRKRQDQKAEYTLNWTLSWNIPASPFSISLHRREKEQASRWELRYDPHKKTPLSSIQASLEKERQREKIQGGFHYRGSRLTGGFSHYRLNPGEEKSSLHLQSAIVFAGSTLSLSKPVHGSFLIVKGKEALGGKKIELGSYSSSLEGESDFLGPAVLSSLSPYQWKRVSVHVPDAPLGADLESSASMLYPTYKSGTLYLVGSKATLIAGGTLLDQEGEPIGLKMGRLVSLDNPEEAPISFSTNRSGKFRAQGLYPGSFAIYLSLSRPPIATIQIPSGVVGYHILGEIYAQREEESEHSNEEKNE